MNEPSGSRQPVGAHPAAVDVDSVPPSFRPRVFALCQPVGEVEDEDCDHDEEETVVVAWGMTLPNGTALAVGHEGSQRSSVAFTSSPDSAAWIFGAEIVWTTTA